MNYEILGNSEPERNLSTISTFQHRLPCEQDLPQVKRTQQLANQHAALFSSTPTQWNVFLINHQIEAVLREVIIQQNLKKQCYLSQPALITLELRGSATGSIKVISLRGSRLRVIST